MTATNGAVRLKPLDGLRSLAIVSVLLFHYVNNAIEPQQANSVDRILRAMTSFGWIGVDLFFVLSGFLITRIILDNIRTANFFKVFYIRRSLRIFPIYFLLLLLYVIISQIITNKEGLKMFQYPIPVWYYALYIQNYAMGVQHNFGPQFLTPTWSLAVEEQFYLVFPFLIYLCRKQFRIPLMLTLVLIAILTRSFLHTNFYAYYTWLPSRIDSLTVGALLATIKTTDYFKARVSAIVGSAKMKYALIGMFLVLILLPEIFPIPIAFKFTIVAFAFGILLFLVLDFGFLNRFLSNRLLVFIGTISYGIYIYHQMVNYLLHWIYFRKDTSFITAEEKLVTMVSVIVTIIMAWASYRYFEYPLIKIGKSVGYKEIDEANQTSPVPLGIHSDYLAKTKRH